MTERTAEESLELAEMLVGAAQFRLVIFDQNMI